MQIHIIKSVSVTLASTAVRNINKKILKEANFIYKHTHAL